MSSSEDSELAAILDEGLFTNDQDGEAIENGAEGAAEADNMLPKAQVGKPDRSTTEQEQADEQAAKRPRTDAGNAKEAGVTSAVAQQASKSGICPPHPGWWQGLCIACGTPRDNDGISAVAVAAQDNGSAAGEATTKIKHLHHRQALEVSANEAARIATEHVNRLLASRRLVLVLDLDHTLLNTVRDIDLVGEERRLAIQQLQQQAQQLAQQHEQQSEGSTAAAIAQEEQHDAKLQAAADLGDTVAAAVVHGGQPSAADAGDSSRSKQGTSVQQLQRPRLYHLADKGLWTKLRPGVEAFLAKVSQLYELHIYTMGDKGYAGLMADLLDPEHKLFVGRVVSAADSTRAGVKDLDVLLADEQIVLILDDTEHVWENHRANLIQVERYHYFGASARTFNLQHSPLQQGTDEPETGGVLDQAAQLLARIHERVFGQTDLQQQQQQVPQQQQQQQGVPEPQQQQQQQQAAGRRVVRRPRAAASNQERDQQQQQQQQQLDAAGGVNGSSSSRPATPAAAAASVLVRDVRDCLEMERKSVLADCCIVFSRCWPQHRKHVDEPLWQLVLKLGGMCSLSFVPGLTTHVVAAPDKNDPGGVPLTDKVQAAQQAGVPVVHPDWLIACKFAWSRVAETKFALPGYKGGWGGVSSRLLTLSKAAVEVEKQAVLKSAGRADA